MTDLKSCGISVSWYFHCQFCHFTVKCSLPLLCSSYFLRESRGWGMGDLSPGTSDRNEKCPGYSASETDSENFVLVKS